MERQCNISCKQFHTLYRRGEVKNRPELEEMFYSIEIDERYNNECWKNQNVSDVMKACLQFERGNRIDIQSLSDAWVDIIETYPRDTRHQVMLKFSKSFLIFF